MRVTVLGNAASYLAPGSGGSGYLLESRGKRVLLDCGGGVADALRGRAPLDALVISHFHHDHVLDLMRWRDAFPGGMPIVVPPGEARRFDALAMAFAFEGPFELPGPVIEATGRCQVAGVELRFARTRHSAPSVATRAGGFVYASDTAPCDELRDLARGADTLLAHTLLPRVDPASGHAARHMTAETAGELARAAGVRRLVLSHRFHESRDEDMLRAAAFPGAVLARTGESFEAPDAEGKA
jgi:ribonuclease BN (tRNA processing enzyme)